MSRLHITRCRQDEKRDYLHTIIPRPNGSGDIAMSLASVRHLSVRPSVTFSCPLNNLNTVWNILMILQLCRTGHNDVSRTKIRALASLLLSYLPFDAFYAYSCPLCILNTLWNIIMILHSYVEQVMTMCRVQE